ncbi:MAG: proton-conducting transporter membrane subunit [Gaiella sp.]
MTGREWLALLAFAGPAMTAIAVLAVPARAVPVLARFGLVGSALAALAAAGVALARPSSGLVGDWVVLDAAAGLMLLVVGLVGLGSLLVSPAYLADHPTALIRAGSGPRLYYAALAAFWAVLVAVPLCGNLGIAWLLVEATTAVSALLVGWTGKPRALEAGWKYLLLTSLGLGFALLGILILASGGGGSIDALSWRALAETAPGSEVTLVAYLLLLVGLAAKVGWAPVHNWLPDAHSEAPPPVSALLSGVLLPVVALVAWRAADALAAPVGGSTTRSLLIGFGLLSLAVAVPFLWRRLAWKRLLAYSSLEHMGVIAIGIGFGSRLALAGVAVHVVGHALAKGLGFCAAVPLLGHDPRAADKPARGLVRTRPALGASMGISLGALAGLPPSPLFVSEVLVVAGGISVGRYWEAGVTAFLLALGFLGLAQALVDTTAGRARQRMGDVFPGLRTVTVLTVTATVLMLVLAGGALWLPGSALVDALVKGLG